ncbi:hypothetical protein [Actinosynnema sp. NPDC020468]|uniref:hypothetical protein n=1 Tax=Actinosynnema sp. NPDC020468 TaxID=3154488 RepID=UPI0033D8797B
MTDTPRPTAGAFAFKLLVRVVLSAVVGSALFVAWIAAYRAGWLDRVVNDTSFGQFLLVVIIGLPVALLVSALLTGPVLWVLRVRPVWPIVLLGPVLVGLASWFQVPEKFPALGDRWTALTVVAGVAYGLAGLLTAPAMLRAKR